MYPKRKQKQRSLQPSQHQIEDTQPDLEKRMATMDHAMVRAWWKKRSHWGTTLDTKAFSCVFAIYMCVCVLCMYMSIWYGVLCLPVPPLLAASNEVRVDGAPTWQFQPTISCLPTKKESISKNGFFEPPKKMRSQNGGNPSFSQVLTLWGTKIVNLGQSSPAKWKG